MNVARLLKAAEFAAAKHRDQRRKGGDGNTPYINHPIAVARVVAEVGGVEDEDILVAALLHDTVEDTPTTPEEVEREFGPRVRGLVGEMTDDKSLPKAERKRLQIVHAGSLSADAVLIKLADKIVNIRDLATAPPLDWPIERMRAYVTWGEAVIQNCRKINPALEACFAKTVREVRGKIDA